MSALNQIELGCNTMNFLLRSTQSSVPAVEAVPAPAAAPETTSGDYKGGWLESSASWPGALNGGGASAGGDYGASDEARLIPGSAKMRTRIAIEDHADVPPGDGAILVPFRKGFNHFFQSFRQFVKLGFLFQVDYWCDDGCVIDVGFSLVGY